MKKSRSYASVRVNHVDASAFATERAGQDIMVGVDVGKFELLAICRWSDGQWERPWRIGNPNQIGVFVALLQELRSGRGLVVALEPSGTYGDALRQALDDAQIEVRQVSTKAAHDYAEVFDGAPSQHDGKDAAVVAELAAHGKASVWPYHPGDAWDQELKYWVEWLEAKRRIWQLWIGKIEGLLGRHWPEATRLLKVSSATLLRLLARYGDPAELARDAGAARRLARWGGRYLSKEKVEALLHSARASVGVRQEDWSRRQMCVCAQQALAARKQMRKSQCRLRRLAQEHPILQAHGRVIGVASACVLWVHVGDPRDYFSARAYRKAMGLNLVERSSGTYKGKLRISKRGHARPRRWLYLAALRLVRQAGIQAWYQAKKHRDAGNAKRALVGVMRKTVLFLHKVAVHGGTFSPHRLFPGAAFRQPAQAKTAQVASNPATSNLANKNPAPERKRR